MCVLGGGGIKKKVKERVVSCKTLEERPLLSLWICSWMRKAVKYVFHSSLILCHNKRIKEYCLRNLHCSRNGGLSADDLRYCSAVFFYSLSTFWAANARRENEGGGRRCGSGEAGAKGHCCRVSPEGKSATNGVIINVCRFEFPNPTAPLLCHVSLQASTPLPNTLA